MPKGRSGPSKSRRKTGVVRGRRVLNTFHIEDDNEPMRNVDAEEIPEESDNDIVKSEDDEDIDSDEAFDEDDEERYSTFKFSGSSSKSQKALKQKARQAESAKPIEEEEEDEDDDNEVYMDLSEMLSTGQTNRVNGQTEKSSGESEEASDDSEPELEDSEMESDGDDDQLDQLDAFVENLVSKKKKVESQAEKAVDTSSIDAEVAGKLGMNDILASLTDPSLQSFRKSLATQQTSKSKSVGQTLSAPLARPIQEKLEREAAYEETKTEISKWQATVKANREADHLQFPMNEPAKQSKQSTATLAGRFEPSTSLEKEINSLLRESGIRDEKDVTTFEEMALKKVSIDEVRARQAKLREMRELMFRQDQKAKRIAKIKSKAYRRIHKRERERAMEKIMDEEGEDAEEANAQRMKMESARARERMTLRHKNTGDWAKRMLSRGQHELETRQAISEQIRRGDVLQRKIMGQDDSGSESDSGEELEDLVREINKWGEDDTTEETSVVRKGVMGMKFMRDAEDARKRRNAEEIAELETALYEDSDEDEVILAQVSTAQDPNPGRKTFTPGNQVEGSDERAQDSSERRGEKDEEVVVKIVHNPFHMNEATKVREAISHSRTSRMATETERSQEEANQKSKNAWTSTASSKQAVTVGEDAIDNPWIISQPKSSKKSTSESRIEKIQKKRKRDDLDTLEARVNIDLAAEKINEILTAANENDEDEQAPTMAYGRGRIAFQQAELINRAFAADGFEEQFAAEKEAAIAKDAPKEEDLTLPGWGAWIGQGVKKRATEKKIIKKIPGIEQSKRKDSKLKHVIINEKTSKANSKYLPTGKVPYPFETREQYERSLSMPVGPEWTTREMYQKVTKPRVQIRAGAVVHPLQKPFA